MNFSPVNLLFLRVQLLVAQLIGFLNVNTTINKSSVMIESVVFGMWIIFLDQLSNSYYFCLSKLGPGYMYL